MDLHVSSEQIDIDVDGMAADNGYGRKVLFRDGQSAASQERLSLSQNNDISKQVYGNDSDEPLSSRNRSLAEESAEHLQEEFQSSLRNNDIATRKHALATSSELAPNGELTELVFDSDIYGNMHRQEKDQYGKSQTDNSDKQMTDSVFSDEKVSNDSVYTREVGPDGQIVFTDAVGLRVEIRGASPEFQERMLREIQNIPEADRALLASRGIRIAIAGRVTDLDPSIANEQPRNWDRGSTQEDTDGIFLNDERRTVVVAEHTRSGPSNRAEGVLRHEIGHAMNLALDNFSDSREFRRAYDMDVRNMSREQRRLLTFWLQPAQGAGRDEALADVYAALRGGVPNREQTEQILRAFPNIARLLRARLQGRSRQH